jgi:hypothetical protein
MSSRDRRDFPRHTPLFTRVFLAWMEGGALKFARGRLCDLSSGGAGVYTPGPFASPEGSVWIGLEGTSMRDWVEGKVVRVVEGELGMSRIGIQFFEPCPLNFFRHAIWGDLAGNEAAAPPEADRPEPTSPASCWSVRRSRSVERILSACSPDGEDPDRLSVDTEDRSDLAQAV